MVIGSVGNLNESCLMELYAVNHKPITSTNRDVLSFMVEFAKYKKEITNVYGIDNAFLIGYEDNVFYVNSFLVTQINNYDAIGCGKQKAKTALYLGHTVEESLLITCELDPLCAEPLIMFDKRKEKGETNDN